MQKLLQEYKAWRKEILAYNYMFYLAGWDSQTYAGGGDMTAYSEYIPYLSLKVHDLVTDSHIYEVVCELARNKDKLEKVEAHEIEVILKEMEESRKLPQDFVERQSRIFAVSPKVWQEAKTKDDFSIFAPVLEQVIQINKEHIGYLETPELKGYDKLLDDFSCGYTQADYDSFFDKLIKELVPFVNEVCEKCQAEGLSFAREKYDKTRQEKFIKYIAGAMGYDESRGKIGESEHPFTTGFGSGDVRFTVHYYERDVLSAIFSAIHEGGHALFEQNIDKNLNDTFSFGCKDMALHESQSRFYENIIGRSREFWEAHLAEFKKNFGTRRLSVKELTADKMYKQVNIVKNSFIRTEADELTYFKHIIVRYKMEQELLNGLSVNEAEKRWNELFEEFFGLTPPSPALGILQDVHWTSTFGYFPSYALGSAFSSQIFDAMNKDFDVLGSLSQGNTLRINEWLKEKIHRYGNSEYANKVFERAVGGKFDPSHYINYLKNKYSELYHVGI